MLLFHLKLNVNLLFIYSLYNVGIRKKPFRLKWFFQNIRGKPQNNLFLKIMLPNQLFENSFDVSVHNHCYFAKWNISWYHYETDNFLYRKKAGSNFAHLFIVFKSLEAFFGHVFFFLFCCLVTFIIDKYRSPKRN